MILLFSAADDVQKSLFYYILADFEVVTIFLSFSELFFALYFTDALDNLCKNFRAHNKLFKIFSPIDLTPEIY